MDDFKDAAERGRRERYFFIDGFVNNFRISFGKLKDN